MGFKPRPLPDCRTCGACCIAPFQQDSFCNIEKKDLKTLPSKALRKIVFPSLLDNLVAIIDGHPAALATKEIVVRAGLLKGVEGTVCAFLRGSPMHKVSCSIYEQRPRVCRDAIRPGSKVCREIRRNLLKDAHRL